MRISIPLTLLVSALAGCGSSDDSSSSFVTTSTTVAVAGTTPMAISAHNLAFLASEGTSGAGGTDFNGDGDMIDTIAVAVNMASRVQTVLNVAAKELAWIGNELYLVVDESADAFDWNVDADQVDTVLLHWSAAANTLVYVDELSSSPNAPHIAAIGTNLFYTAETTPSGPAQSNLRVISYTTPLTTTMVGTQDLTAELEVEILAVDEGLVFLELDEVDAARDLNGDADMLDTHVLALLDGTLTTTLIRNTGLAMDSDDGPFRAKKISGHDWDVGFLVSEAAQGAANLNDPALFDSVWQATQCATFADADAVDEILYFIHFAGWEANQVTSPPRNTGLAGRDRIAIANGFIATICAEIDEGTCDLNQDGDTTDEVVRWTAMVNGVSPILPPNAAANLHAVFDCPGGSHGLVELDNHLVMQVSENQDDLDIDNDGFKTRNLLGWLLPAASPTIWDFTPGTTASFVGASWMREKKDRLRLNVAFLENVAGININVHVPAVAGEDLDTLDSVPTFADFTNTSTISYPGVAIAVHSANPGMVIGRDIAFYRVDEAADSRDWNADGDETDMILFRTNLSQGTSSMMGVISNVTRLAVDLDEIGNPTGAAFLADESTEGAGFDYNADGDTTDLVVRYFIY